MGTSGLLAVDRLPYRLLAGWVAFVRAGAVWLLLCLPVVTAPAATVVLLRTVSLVVEGSTPPTLAESWRLVRSHLGSSLRLAGLLVVGTAICAAAVFGPSPGGWDTVLAFVTVPVALTWALVCPWAFPALEQRSDRSALAALRAAYLRALRRPDLAIGSGLGTLGLVAIGALLPTAVWIPYWLTVPGLWAALVTYTSRRAATAAGATNLVGRS